MVIDVNNQSNHLKEIAQPMNGLNNKILLPLNKIPKKWLNIAPFLPEKPYPCLLPNGMPASPEIMEQIFPSECVKQAMSEEEFIEIPREIREALVLCNRPTPLVRAFRLEKALGLDSDKIKIFYKAEYVSPTGSHKGNTALAQAFYAKQDKIKVRTEENEGKVERIVQIAMGIPTWEFDPKNGNYDLITWSYKYNALDATYGEKLDIFGGRDANTQHWLTTKAYIYHPGRTSPNNPLNLRLTQVKINLSKLLLDYSILNR